jgi:hypothetical protein
MSIFPRKLITSLVLFSIVPILLLLETDYDNIFPIYMIRMLLLFYKMVSYVAVRIVDCSSAMLDPSTLPLGPVKHAARYAERDRLTRQVIQATNLVFYVGKVPLENVTEYKYLGCPLSADDSDNAAVSLNISKAT